MEKSEGGGVDRLRHFPVDVLQHILSFLDTKQAVQTSVLSKRWRNIWTRVPVLDFDTELFHSTLFKGFVYGVLANRDPDSPVTKLRFHNQIDRTPTVEKALSYAIARNVNHVIFHIHFDDHDSIPDVLSLCQSLKTLELTNFNFEKGISFAYLTTLHLNHCSFFYNSECCDVLASCPSLGNLCLFDCAFKGFKVFRISGPRLVSLAIQSLNYTWGGLSDGCKVEISAPNLVYLNYTYSEVVDFSVIDVPSLECAEIGISLPYEIRKSKVEDQLKEKAHTDLFNFFQGLHHAQLVTIMFATIRTLTALPVDILEHKLSPFSRLKTLRLKAPSDFKLSMIPETLSKYFLGGSSCAEVMHVGFPKRS